MKTGYLSPLLLTVFVVFLFSNAAKSQTAVVTDTTKKEDTSFPIQMYTFLPKLIQVDYNFFLPQKRKYAAQNDKKLSSSLGYSQHVDIKVAMPIIKKEKGFGAALSMQYGYFNQQSIKNNWDQNYKFGSPSSDATYAKLGASISQMFTIKKHKLVLTGIVSSEGKQFWDINKITGVISAALPLRNDKNTSLTLGLSYIISRNAIFPVMPTIVYSKKINQNWHLDMLLPSYLKVRYVKNDRLFYNGGVKLGQDVPQLSVPSTVALPENMELRNTNIRFFVGLEKHLKGMFWLNGELGYNYIANSILAEPEDRNDDYLLKATNHGSVYGSVGIFIRPQIATVMQKFKGGKK